VFVAEPSICSPEAEYSKSPKSRPGKELIMPRLVKRFRKPYAVNVGAQTVSICGCELSATQPFCDGTHKISESEAAGKLYWHDDAGQRHLASPGDGYYIRSDQQTQEA
jgi:CDGSH-type Zn-finger protein